MCSFLGLPYFNVSSIRKAPLHFNQIPQIFHAFHNMTATHTILKARVIITEKKYVKDMFKNDSVRYSQLESMSQILRAK